MYSLVHFIQYFFLFTEVLWSALHTWFKNQFVLFAISLLLHFLKMTCLDKDNFFINFLLICGTDHQDISQFALIRSGRITQEFLGISLRFSNICWSFLQFLMIFTSFIFGLISLSLLLLSQHFDYSALFFFRCLLIWVGNFELNFIFNLQGFTFCCLCLGISCLFFVILSYSLLCFHWTTA